MAPAAVGGLERVVEALASGHRARGHQVSVIATVGRSGDAHPVVVGLREAGLTVHTVVAPSRAYRAELGSLRRVLADPAPAVLHTHGYRSDVLGWWAGRSTGTPVVSTVHGFTGGSVKNRVFEAVQVRVLRRVRRVVAVSELLAHRLRAQGVPGDSLQVIRNAVPATASVLDRHEARRVLGLPERGQVIGWVGRLSPEKGPDTLVDAVARLDPAVRVSLIGDGPLRVRLEEETHRRADRERFRFHGHVPDAGSLLRAFDVVVLSSRTEGTPITLLEAIRARVPVVATSVGGIPEVVSSLEARLVAAEDASGLAAAVEQTLCDPVATAERVNHAFRRLTREGDPERWLTAYEDVYRTALEERTRA